MVEAAGSGANRFQPGQRVVAAGWGAGTWQNYVCIPEAKLVRTCGTSAQLSAD